MSVAAILNNANPRKVVFPNRSKYIGASRRLSVFTFIPKTLFSILRIPIAAAGAGLGVVAYTHHRVTQIIPKFILDFKLQDWIPSPPVIDEVSMNRIAARFNDYEPYDTYSYVADDEQEEKEEPELFGSLVIQSTLAIVSNESEAKPPLNLTMSELENLTRITKKMIQIRQMLSNIKSTDKSLALPAIVVIGSQSSGKSSLLESIVGREFLPK